MSFTPRFGSHCRCQGGTRPIHLGRAIDGNSFGDVPFEAVRRVLIRECTGVDVLSAAFSAPRAVDPTRSTRGARWS